MIALTTLSLGYELYRATAMAGVSVHDSFEGVVLLLPLYVVGVVLASRADAGHRWAAGAVLGYSGIVLAISLLHYNRVVMPVRQPGPIDWFEDVAFTAMVALVFVRSFERVRRTAVAPGTAQFST